MHMGTGCDGVEAPSGFWFMAHIYFFRCPNYPTECRNEILVESFKEVTRRQDRTGTCTSGASEIEGGVHRNCHLAYKVGTHPDVL